MRIDLLQQSPTRRPSWRLARVIYLLSQRMRPTRADCHYVRAYRRLLLEWEKYRHHEMRRGEVFEEFPDVYQAHQLHYSSDVETRQILEACLLTPESFAAIGKRFGVTPKAIEYYEAIFFNVRDRLSNRNWIRMVIRGNCRRIGAGADDRLSLDQRGYVLRLLAYFGGPLALDAMINGMVPASMPQDDKDVGPWFQDVLSQLVQTTAFTAASTLPLNQRNSMRMIKLAVKSRRRDDTDRIPPTADLAERLMMALQWLPEPDSK